MNNMEGFQEIEVTEKNLERSSITVSEAFDSNNYDDCALTDEQKLLMQEIERDALSFDDCSISLQPTEVEDDMNFESFRRR